jgi:hypothetical protein
MTPDERKADHEARVKAQNEANVKTAATMAMPPTPTQEENDLTALGLLNPDDKKTTEPPEPEKSPSAPAHQPAAAAQHRDARR